MITGQNDGFSIEDKLLISINNKYFKDISPEIKSLLTKVTKNITDNDYFLATKKGKKGLQKKTDLFITRNNNEFCNLSIKSGTGNSVHQENIYEFVSFFKNLGVIDKEIEPLLFFHWGDGSLDGSFGDQDITKRMKSRQLNKNYPNIIPRINELFNKHKRQLIERILLGSIDGNEPNYLIYVSQINFFEMYFSDIKSLIDLHCKIIPTNEANIKVGNFSFQNWNRCLLGQDKVGSKHRNDIQFKWTNLREDIKSLYEK